jgi:hypothetical protein
MTSRLAIATVLALATTAAAQPAAPRVNPRSTFDGTVTATGTAMPFLCGILMATQDVTLTVTKVDSGAMKVGATPTIRVLTCFGGHLLRPIANAKAPVFELDPAKIRVGSVIHIDAEDLAKDAWFATVDKITVTKR